MNWVLQAALRKVVQALIAASGRHTVAGVHQPNAGAASQGGVVASRRDSAPTRGAGASDGTEKLAHLRGVLPMHEGTRPVAAGKGVPRGRIAGLEVRACATSPGLQFDHSLCSYCVFMRMWRRGAACCALLHARPPSWL